MSATCTPASSTVSSAGTGTSAAPADTAMKRYTIRIASASRGDEGATNRSYLGDGWGPRPATQVRSGQSHGRSRHVHTRARSARRERPLFGCDLCGLCVLVVESWRDRRRERPEPRRSENVRLELAQPDDAIVSAAAHRDSKAM